MFLEGGHWCRFLPGTSSVCATVRARVFMHACKLCIVTYSMVICRDVVVIFQYIYHHGEIIKLYRSLFFVFISPWGDN